MSARVSSGKDSKQNYGTPQAFIDALKTAWVFDSFDWDLAADAQNTKADRWFGEIENSLSQDWAELSGWLWLNPPYADITPWVRKVYESTRVPGRNLFMLIPASVGSNWYRDWVHKKCDVYFLTGRLTFDGADSAYPRDLMLCGYGGVTEEDMVVHPPALWDWRTNKFAF